MNLKNIPRKYFIFIPIGLLLAILLIWLFLFLNKETPEPDQQEYAVSEEAINSVLTGLSENEKIGMFIFLSAEIKDSNDYQQLHNLTLKNGISSWLIRTPSFDHHKQFSDSLQKICTAPPTYAIEWNSTTGDVGHLPPLQLLSSIANSDFIKSFAVHFAELLQTHGITTVFIPSLFDSVLTHVPSLYQLNVTVNIIENIFRNDLFSPTDIIFQNRNSTVINTDTSLYFPGNELFQMMLNKFNFSTYSSSDLLSANQSLSVLEFHNETDIQKFPNSPATMILVTANKIEEVFSSLKKIYGGEKEALDDKLKQIISLKLLQQEFSNFHTFEALPATSTAWRTYMLQLAENCVCVAKNKNQFIPFSTVSDLQFIVAKDCHIPFFHESMKKTFAQYRYAFCETDEKSVSILIDKLPPSNKVVFIQDQTHHFDFTTLQLITLKEKHLIGLVDFSVNYDEQIHESFQMVVLAGIDRPDFQSTAANIICGSTKVGGRIFTDDIQKPVIYSKPIEVNRLKESWPEDANVDGEYVYHTIDSIINDAINRGAFPGCQVWAAKDSKIIFNKAYGYHSYDKHTSVKKSDLYDVASVTKIAATTIAAMRMCDIGKLSLNEPIKKYFRNIEINYTRIKPDTNVIIDTLNLLKVDLKKLIKQGKIPKDTFRIRDTLMVIIDSVFSKATPSLNIFTVPVRYMLMHFSGISPTLPILPFIQIRKYYLKEHNINETDSLAKTINWKDVWEIYYSNKRADSTLVRIADGMYLKNRWLDSLWQRTKEVGVSSRKHSQYTDLNMILVQQTIDTINRSNLDKFMQKEFYGPLGLQNTMYLPRDKNISLNRIAPTENDKSWRRQVIHGFVHDPSAAMLGGISGNAGLFTSAEDLGVLFQMLLNGGTYGTKRYLSEKIIKLFTTTNEETGRGLGFDKWGQKNIVAPSASPNTYGHTGFTGCCVWVDPDSKLVFVFLSNRVHPNVNNQRINGLKIRQKIHQVFYDAEIKKP